MIQNPAIKSENPGHSSHAGRGKEMSVNCVLFITLKYNLISLLSKCANLCQNLPQAMPKYTASQDADVPNYTARKINTFF